jgi:fatty acid desaturase
MYRLYRHPVVLFVLGPSYLFILQNRLPMGLMNAGWRYWTSAMGTNAMIGIALGLIIWFGGLLPVLVVFLPTSVMQRRLVYGCSMSSTSLNKRIGPRATSGSCMTPR